MRHSLLPHSLRLPARSTRRNAAARATVREGVKFECKCSRWLSRHVPAGFPRLCPGGYDPWQEKQGSLPLQRFRSAVVGCRPVPHQLGG